jgi:3-oxoacyl-[acyl-carrier protein] reductase
LRRFEGETVLVTGGARDQGISFATARAFLEEGARVLLFDRDRDGLASSEAALAPLGKVCTFSGDVRRRDHIEAALDYCEQELGPVGVLINHAGIGPSQHTLEITADDWDQVLGINLSGVFRVGQCVAARMADQGRGVILNMSSTAGIAAEPGHAHYAASKAAVLALTRAMAHDLKPYGIRVCALCPGDIDTYSWGNVELARIYRSRIAAGRSGKPEEVAAVYLYLASEDARNLNGCAFIVDGGMLAWE